MLSLFRLFSLPYLRRRPLKVLLTILGMASGIAVYTAIDLSNRSVLNSFRYSLQQTSGKSDLTLSPKNRNLTNQDYRILAQNSPSATLTPILELNAFCTREKIPLTLLGIDPLTRGPFFSPSNASPTLGENFLKLMATPQTILISSSLAKLCNITPSQEVDLWIEGAWKKFYPLVLEESSIFGDAPLAFADIATAQEASEQKNRLGRIEVKLKNQKISEWVAQMQSLVPEGLLFSPQEQKLKKGEDILQSFQLNLFALGLIAVFVSIFIVYNSVSLALLYRRSELGMLRAIGADRWQIAGVFTLEILLLATISGILGILLGWGLAQLIFGQILKTVNELYLPTAASGLSFSFKSLVTAMGLALAAAGVGALLPLTEAFKISPLEATRRLSFEKYLRHHSLFLVLCSASCFALAGISAKLSSMKNPSWGFGTALMVLVGFLFATPFALKLLLKFFNFFSTKLRWSFSQIAASQIKENPYRYSVVTASLALGVALWIGIGMMVFSFRTTVVDWIGSTIRGDIYLFLRENENGNYPSFLPTDFVEAVEKLPGLERIDTLRSSRVRYEGQELRLASIALKDFLSQGQMKFVSGSSKIWNIHLPDPSSTIPAALAESLARRHHLQVGDRFTIDTEWGSWPMQVGAIIYDYTSEQGILYIDREDFKARNPDPRIHSIALFLKDPTSAAKLLSEIQALPSAPQSLKPNLNGTLKNNIMKVFDQTFRVTEALKAVALFVAFLGILTTLITLLEEKRREIGLLQSLGMTPNQLKLYALSQGLCLSLAGYVLGTLCGISLCYVIVRVINYDYFGWTIFLDWDWRLIALSFVLTLAVGLLASLGPMFYLSRMKPSQALRFEE